MGGRGATPWGRCTPSRPLGPAGCHRDGGAGRGKGEGDGARGRGRGAAERGWAVTYGEKQRKTTKNNGGSSPEKKALTGAEEKSID
jgi:hypothetical protein